MAVFCVLILWLVSQFTLGYVRQHQDLFVFEQLARFKNHADNMPRSDFIAELNRLIKKHGSALVVLKTKEGYYGNLNYLPDTVPASPDVGNFLILNEDDSGFTESGLQQVRGSKISTRWGSILVAYNASDFYLFSSLIQWALYAAMLLALIAGSLTGFLFTRRLLRRINQINIITAEVKDGSLDARVPVSKSQDEFDELACRINAMLDQLKNGMEAIASVTDNIAHDLRTPLSRLRIRIEDQLSKGTDSEEQLLLLRSELDTILSTFNAMLELSRLEQGSHNLTMSPCNLAELCADAVELAEPLAEWKHQTLTVETGNSFTLEGNRELLFRMIYNLIENSIKYSPENSAIGLHVDQDRLTIHDQGPGIPEEEQKNVFRRLYRLDQSRKEAGFGLGLSLVRVVANLHSLTISLENHGGLCVTIRKG